VINQNQLTSYYNHNKFTIQSDCYFIFLDRDQSTAMCQNLLDRKFAYAVKKSEQEKQFADDDTLYRFLEDEESNALNSGMESLCEPRPAHEVGETLRHLILTLYNSYLSADGKVCTR